MSDDQGAAVAANHDEPRPTMASEEKYTLSIIDAIERYKAAGIPRTLRTVQRYCSNKTLDAHRFAIPYGEKYLITFESLERHIAYIVQGKAAMADHGEPRQDMTFQNSPTFEGRVLGKNDEPRVGMSDHAGQRAPSASESDGRIVLESTDIVGTLREENKFLKEQITVKDAQLSVKDRQIADQSERVRETNLLVASLHKLITPLIGRTDDIHPPRQ